MGVGVSVGVDVFSCVSPMAPLSSLPLRLLSFCHQAKLRYDPVELDPEDMCRMASEDPQVHRYTHTDAHTNTDARMYTHNAHATYAYMYT